MPVQLDFAHYRIMRKSHFLVTVLLALTFAEMAFAQDVGTNKPLPVTVSNFVRAESDYYFGKTVKQDGFGKLSHTRQMAPKTSRMSYASTATRCIRRAFLTSRRRP